MPAPTIDGSNSGIFSTNTTATLALTTTNANDLICVLIAAEQTNGAIAVNNIQSTGLLFEKVQGRTYRNGGNYTFIELWIARARSVLSAQNITVNLTATIDDACWGVFGVRGCYLPRPLDPNPNSRFSQWFFGTTAFNQGAIGGLYGAAIPWSTDTNDCLALFAAGTTTPGLTGFLPTARPNVLTWTGLFNLNNGGGGAFCQMIAATAPVVQRASRYTVGVASTVASQDQMLVCFASAPTQPVLSPAGRADAGNQAMGIGGRGAPGIVLRRIAIRPLPVTSVWQTAVAVNTG